MSKFVTFRQADSRWGNMTYPYKPYYVKDVGCGPTACASIIYNINRSITPKETAYWMIKRGYALPGNGTAANGITACLKSYGYTVNVHNDMQSFWKSCAAGNVAGIIWFRKGTKGGITWTTTGHYVAFSGYKVENGKHYLYTRDPGGRHNDGWHCYETQMYGLIVELWTVNVPGQSPVSGPTYYKAIETMNIRSGASTKYKIVGTIQAGGILKSTQENSGWVYTPDFAGAKGWVCAKYGKTVYLSKVDTAKETLYQTNEAMNVRRGASTRYKIIRQIPKGTIFMATKSSGNWVWTPTYNGWVCIKDSKTQYCTRIG